MTEVFPKSTGFASKNMRCYPRILVITSCTGEKRYKSEKQLTLEDFKDSSRFQSSQTLLEEFACPAGEMYTGQQHRLVMEGVSLLRQAVGSESVGLRILSAGYGLIPEDKIIVPYEVSFTKMRGYELDDWAKVLGVHSDFEKAIAGYDLVFVLLGENYLRATFGSPLIGSLCLPVETCSNQTFIFLTSSKSANYIRDNRAKTYVLPLSNAHAKHYRYGLVGLKGFLFKRFAECVARDGTLLQKVYDEPEVFVQIVDTEPVQLEIPLGLPEVKLPPKSVKKPRIGKSEDKELIPIPTLPPAPNWHLGMQYFIPEWDDRVDPRYDFLRDALTPGRDPYEDDIYAHQIYYSPNYNGILVSKGIIERSKKKKAQIEKIGIHKFIRFSDSVMGDCGAFGYIKEEVPPYNTEEILDYYQRIGFDYGVSIDHLIVGSFAELGVREKRYELTIKNAEEFIQKHRTGGYKFTPIGAVQGWSPDSYAKAVKAYIEMGYEYIGLGGLARTPSKEILEILESIHPHLTPQTRMHLFGVGRLNAVPVLRHLGVTSFDSASPLRKAWLDSAANYHTFDGKTYAAIRIPKVDGSRGRIKRLLEAGVSELEPLKRLEEKALHTLREFDAGSVTLESTLDALLALDEFLELPRNGQVNPQEKARRLGRHAQMYRELLEEQPWKKCDCVICQEIGIEVVIFRGNDRNRRRGFHNTYIFHKRFNALLKGEKS